MTASVTPESPTKDDSEPGCRFPLQTYFYSILGKIWTDYVKQGLTMRTTNWLSKENGCPAPLKLTNNNDKKRTFASLFVILACLIYFLLEHTSTSCKKVFYWNSIKTQRFTKHRLYMECDRWLHLKRCFAFGDGDWESKVGPDDNVFLCRGRWWDDASQFTTSAYVVDRCVTRLHLPACVGLDETWWLSLGW